MRRYTINVGGKEFLVDVEELGEERFQVRVGNREFEVGLVASEDSPDDVLEKEHSLSEHSLQEQEGAPEEGGAQEVPRHTPLYRSPASEGEHYEELAAPMPGTIISVKVSAGDVVQYGQVLFVLEAMKMKNSLQSPQDGVVVAVLVEPGQKVNTGEVLVRFSHITSEPNETEENRAPSG
jgi:biotin carboxyl carrier protein